MAFSSLTLRSDTYYFLGFADVTSDEFASPPKTERCPSGLRSTPGKRVYAYRRTEGSNPSLSAKYFKSYNVLAVYIGLSATICCEPRQVRKEATVMTDSGAGVRLVYAATLM